MMRFIQTTWFAATCTVWFVSAGRDSASQDRAPGEAGGENGATVYEIGMSQCNLGEPWRVQMNADIRAAADDHDRIGVTFKDAQNDTLKQRAHVEEFVSAEVDLIIISPKEAQPLTEPVAHAVEAGIPVIVLDRRVMGDAYTCFMRTEMDYLIMGSFLLDKARQKPLEEDADRQSRFELD